MQEASSSILFRHWLKANYNKFDSCSFEIKDTRGAGTFNMKELKEEQRNHALANKSEKGNLIRTVGTTGCADYHFMRKAYAYVVIFFPKVFFVIDIDDIIKEKRNLSTGRAEEIALFSVKL